MKKTNDELVEFALSLTPHILQAAKQFTEFTLQDNNYETEVSDKCFLETVIFILHIINRHVYSRINIEEERVFRGNLEIDTIEHIIKLSNVAPLDQTILRSEYLQLLQKRTDIYRSFRIKDKGETPSNDLYMEFSKIIFRIMKKTSEKDGWDPIAVIKVNGDISLILANYPILPSIDKFFILKP